MGGREIGSQRCCCLESSGLSSPPSQQMAQELVWDEGELRLPAPSSLSLLLSPPPAIAPVLAAPGVLIGGSSC